MSLLSASLQGAGLGASLIVAIGAQNAFVLRQGLQRQHVLLVVALCSLCDVALILAGGLGLGNLIAAHPEFARIMAWLGAGFLLVYGALALRRALHPGALQAGAELNRPAAGWRRITGLTLAVSLLNPHVYLDTVLLLGSVASQHQGLEHTGFLLGAMLASCLWFSLLGFGARWLQPVFARPAAWRVLDVLIGLIMWTIAASLLRS